MSLKEFVNAFSVQSIIAIAIVLGGLLMLSFLELKESVEVSIVNLMIMVVGYFFGSSRSTATKDKTIATIAENAAK